MSSRLALSLLFTLNVLIALGIPAFSLAADEPSADLQAQVKQLVQQLGGADADKQLEAETALLKLGPDILPLLPEANGNKRLQTIRSTLRDAQAQKELAPSLVTLQGETTLTKALQTVVGQTGIQVEDRRMAKDEDPKVKLDLSKATFWQALDAIAQEADLRVSVFEGDNKVALRDGPHQALPISYSGLFRVAVKRLTVVRELETNEHFCMASLEVAWEPRFQPLFLETKPVALKVEDDNGTALKVADTGSGRAPVAGRSAIETQVRLAAPRRAANKIGLLQGSLEMVGPSKMLTFSFDNLVKIAKGEPRREETREGVSVRLEGFSTERVNDADRWKITLSLKYPPDGPDFESFESWLVNNQITLEKKGTKPVPPAAYETGDQSAHQASLTYYFVEENDVVLGKPEDWKLVYRTPGNIVKVPIKFEFKDLPLP